MKLWVDENEEYPVYSLHEHEHDTTFGKEVELTKDEYEAYLAVVNTYWKWQLRIGKLSGDICPIGNCTLTTGHADASCFEIVIPHSDE